ncbi:MAG: DUF4395 domain-containing protein [Cyclobacteriaceae bacterium]|nr:DUF4395 domain-containing protein [Cyclobacteriaceae bacterium]
MNKIFNFGEHVPGYSVPVLNEREIRAAAGVLFFIMFMAIQRASLVQDFTLIKYGVTFFLIDIVVRVLVNPRYAPTLILGRLIVRNQAPEYVAAPQKKFAWSIGIGMALVLFIHLVVSNSWSPISGILCMICLMFLFFEAAFGICLGCAFYPLFFKNKPELCPGGSCESQPKQPIQKTTRGQILIVLLFVAFIVFTVYMFHDAYSEQPYDLFGLKEKFES